MSSTGKPRLDLKALDFAVIDKVYDELSQDDIQFLKTQTGLDDDGDLKRHVLAIRDKSLQIYPYPCIIRLSFARPSISKSPAYLHALQLAEDHQDAIFLDLGCFAGSDIRRAVADGYPPQNIVGTDLRAEFWELGHELFKSTPTTFPAHFIAGDALDPSHLPVHPPMYADSSPPVESPLVLQSITSLAPLRGRVSIIYTAYVFHLFTKERQAHLASAMAGLLSPRSGSMIFGRHVAMKEEGTRTWRTFTMFCHSPQSWKELWDGGVFRAGQVRVHAALETVDYHLPGFEGPAEMMTWSVTRL